MVHTKYYPAYLLNPQEYDDAEECLSARGCSEEDAQKIIALARIHQSEIVLHIAAPAPDDCFLVIAEDGGKWRTWAARSAAMRDTREMAMELMEGMGKDVEWKIFGMHEHDSLRSAN